jgi:phosphomannomutase
MINYSGTQLFFEEVLANLEFEEFISWQKLYPAPDCGYNKCDIWKIQRKFINASIDERDGIKLSWDNAWIHIRKSNTESIIRIYAEATTKQHVLKLK